jgi:hypothetical protein
MGMSDYIDDLRYLYTELLKHPAFLENGVAFLEKNSKAAFEALFMEKCALVSNYDSFIEAATKLTCFFNDGHTNIELPYTASNLCLRLKCEWDKEDANNLVLSEPYEEIPAHAKITHVEDVPIDEIIQLMASFIPHENIYLVKSRIIRYPYRNYHVFSELNLKRLFGAKTSYLIAFNVNGQLVTKAVPLLHYDGYPAFAPDEEFLTYEIKDNVAIMHLKSCIFNDVYKDSLKELASICKSRGIKTFILDLSENMGGDSTVIEHFISYTHCKKYRVYEMVNYSSGNAEIVTRREDETENRQQEVLLPEKIYCKVSFDTFSSARTFAVTLCDNRIAEVIGNPTGGKPNSYGMPRKCVMPKTNTRFRVSTSRFRRPDSRKDDEISLFPSKK